MPQWTTYAHEDAKIFRDDYSKNSGEFKTVSEYWEDFSRRATRGFANDTEPSANAGCSLEDRVKTFVTRAAMAVLWYNSNLASHIFINSDMADFLSSSVREVSKDYICIKSLRSLTIGDTGVGAFIHFDTGWPGLAGVNKSMCFGVQDWGIWAHIPGTISFRWPIAEKPSADELTHVKGPVDALLGLSLYLEAFPDALQEFQAPSKEFKRKQTLTLRVPKEVQEDIDHSVSPHYRRGHMRLLTSERYTEEKRGKAVFVKGCFVKGKAYEVVG